MRRLAISAAAAFVGFAFSFVVFNIAYMSWAEWRYPRNNSMAGLVGFLYGLPVGALAGGAVFALAFWKLKPRATDPPQSGK